MKAIIVGRHSGQISGVEVVGQENIQFPATAEECQPIIVGLIEKAQAADAVLLFQMTPGQVAVAIGGLVLEAKSYEEDFADHFRGWMLPIRMNQVGVVISKPAPRGQAITMTTPGQHGQEAIEDFCEMLKLANPNAKISVDTNSHVTLAVDPPMKFEFSHIEWF